MSENSNSQGDAGASECDLGGCAPKKYVICNDCGKVHLWTKDEYQSHASDGCSCGCCVFSIGDSLQDVRNIAAMTKIN